MDKIFNIKTDAKIDAKKNSAAFSKEKSRETSKKRILDTAMKLFAKRGFDGVSVREICKIANVNLCMISYHFGGKKELYQAIIDNLIQNQMKYAKTFVDFDMDLSKKSKKELVDFLHFFIDKLIDYMFAEVSKELIAFLIVEQQKQNAIVNPPALIFVRKVLAHIFDMDENDKEITFKVLFLIGNVITPRVLLHFSLNVLKQDDFNSDDVAIIKKNVHRYVDSIVKEVQFD